MQRIVGKINHRSRISGCSEVEATRCDAIFHLLGAIRGHPLQRGIEAHVPTAIGDVWAFQRAGPWPVNDRECRCQVNGSPRDNPIIVQATTTAAGAIRQPVEDLDRLTRRLRCSMAPLPPQWRHHMLTSTDFISVGSQPASALGRPRCYGIRAVVRDCRRRPGVTPKRLQKVVVI
ncbi:hypothetical protein J2W32_005883 [Variovorax boronicumulans]|uniref:Uncharacterized protein n=1 Tax=Variovorax boronicumulans TaxID=436515 RepID=A0AAW8D771_9BURK|nr:hypothetical protein [Variovorax boronicumulans]MDP9993955.1 hypothetical protein [Variovorax boronicumulans]MDQ0005182.1 hypothetical protein [Variovorax boronicumulans]MDQ0038999.1 hypothetical protein [Variovorax boronicumulans]MDQ0056809.1 hypothetical protein [Variovorax boronicumulans]